MKFRDFHKHINTIFDLTPEYARDDLIVAITLASPSVGSCASVPVKGVNRGRDWDSGTILISAESRLVTKKKDEDVFDMSRDLLIWLATKPAKRKSYETNIAQSILKRIGYTDEELDTYRTFIHQKK